MDLRDSSSSSAAVSRDGSSADEDGLLSVTTGIAKDGALLFQSRRFAECVDVLNQLLLKKEDDPKVLHNIAVAEYFRDGCSDPRKLLDVLNKVKLMLQKKSGELDQASGEQSEVTSNLGNNFISGSKGSNITQPQFSGASISNISYMDGFDTSVTVLNIAIVLFHLREYANASSILEPLYQNIEPIEESTALHICLLLLDLALASHDASKAADVIQYVEKAFGVGHIISQGDNGSGVQHQYSKSSSVSNSSTAQEGSNSDSHLNVNASENNLSRTLSDEALEYETLLSTLDIDEHNLARPSGLPSLNDISTDRYAPAVDLKLKLHLYKVRLLLLTRNLKAAKREVKLAMNIARGRDSSTALLLKSQLEYARGNHRKAIKLLMTSINRSDSGISSIFNNNLGCIYHRLGKHHTSDMYFSKALRFSSSLLSEKPKKLSTFPQEKEKSLLILYNCGLEKLACGRPLVAARCFHKASSVFHGQPLLWLRIAECCLLALRKGELKSSGSAIDGEILVHVVGNGKWRQLLVEDGASRYRHLDSLEEDDGLLLGDDQQKLSLNYARQCLMNAMYLLNKAESRSLTVGLPSNSASEEDESSQTGGDSKSVSAYSSQGNANGDPKELKGVSTNPTLESSLVAYEDMCRRENHVIKQAVLADLSYVELTLENPWKALSAARSLLELSECSRLYIFLGHIYAAEALCRLNRLKEAAEHLSVYISDRNTVEVPYSGEDTKKLKVEIGGDSEELNGGSFAAHNQPTEESQDILFLKPEEARGALFVNLATMSVLQGDFEQARIFAREALSTIPDSPKAILTAIYVDLLTGRAQEALVKLKQCRHVRFLSNGVSSDHSSW